LTEVIGMLERRYPPALAAQWDAVGLVCGDPDMSVARVLFAVDADMAVVDEALMTQADLIVAHHPLLLRAVNSVAATTYKGRILHTLITHGIALYTAHTNADHASPGVSDALAAAIGVHVTGPLLPDLGDPALGTGRVGTLPTPVTLAEFAEHVASALPTTAAGLRVAGHPEAVVRTVAVCGGSGDDLLAVASSLADVYVTSDLRHHPGQEHVAAGGCALIDVPHWAGEWPWLPVAARSLAEDVEGAGSTVGTYVSGIVTDPWTSHLGSNR
jgi:dinuclear metal center YbgI/SA1388 family protein